jgi:RecB family exonuclease
VGKLFYERIPPSLDDNLCKGYMAKRVESPSSINTFKQCKRKYYYSYIEKLPSVPSIHLVRGNIAHSALEDFYDIDVSKFNEENCQKEFQQAVQKLLVYQWDKYGPKLNDLGLNNDKLKFYFEETMLMLMNWCKYFLADIKQLIKEKNISVQEAFTELTPVREQKFSSEEYSVRGFIDAVHHCGDEIHILDYKTNARFDMKESIKLQLAIYSLLYQEKKGVMPHKVGIFFLRHKSKYMNVEPGLIELAKREINSIHSHTSSTEHVDDYPQTITPLCKWSTGQCDYYHACKPHG